MKLFVDDVRACPNGWVLARTVTEAIRLIDTQVVEEVSLDHDIACRLVTGQEHTSNETFEPVARFISSWNSEIPWTGGIGSEKDLIRVRIHTSNFVAGRKMADILGIEYDHYLYDEKDYE